VQAGQGEHADEDHAATESFEQQGTPLS
jgi:hypothetical protein